MKKKKNTSKVTATSHFQHAPERNLASCRARISGHPTPLFSVVCSIGAKGHVARRAQAGTNFRVQILFKVRTWWQRWWVLGCLLGSVPSLHHRTCRFFGTRCRIVGILEPLPPLFPAASLAGKWQLGGDALHAGCALFSWVMSLIPLVRQLVAPSKRELGLLARQQQPTLLPIIAQVF